MVSPRLVLFILKRYLDRSDSGDREYIFATMWGHGPGIPRVIARRRRTLGCVFASDIGDGSNV
jgi:hypothetical protein